MGHATLQRYSRPSDYYRRSYHRSGIFLARRQGWNPEPYRPGGSFETRDLGLLRHRSPAVGSEADGSLWRCADGFRGRDACVSSRTLRHRKYRHPRPARFSYFSLWPKQPFSTPLPARYNLLQKPAPAFAPSPFRLPRRKEPAKPSAAFALLPASKSAIAVRFLLIGK